MDHDLFDEFLNNFGRQLLSDDNWQPGPSERNSRRSRRENAGLDRDTCVQAHNAAREQFTMMLRPRLSRCSLIVTTTFVQESPTASAPLSSLKPITLQQLVVGKRHYGRVLHGRLCVKPFQVSGIVSVLEDEAGNGARLAIYNALPAAASLEEVVARFPLGMRVVVKEPFFKICVDGKTSIRVDNPTDIALDETWKKDISPVTSCGNATLLTELEVIRSEGNELFGAQNWIGAVSKYSECIDKGTCRLGTQNNREMSDDFNRVVMLAYSNRAEARLRLGAFEDALSDADKALEFDQKQVKTIVRKGKAAYGLGLFEKSCAMFEAALENCPNEVSILDNLKASKIALAQSRTGKYDLSNYYLRRCTGDVPACADFVGPVEIRRVHRGYGGRGLFATEKVEPGQLLLVSNPLAIRRRKADLQRLDLSFLYQRRGGFNGAVNAGVQLDALAELADQVMKSTRKMAQLHSLSSYGKLEMEIPSMELFRPGSEWVPLGSERMEVDIALIREIAKLNAFGSNSVNLPKRNDWRAKGDAPVEDEWSGIWALPSFVNHSCAPNCMFVFVGDAMFIRAGVHIAKGDELTISYYGSLFEDVGTRQASCKPWYFTCKCERCQLEETLKPQLAKISKAFPNLVEAAEAECAGGQRKRQAVKDLAKVADEIEAVIHSCGTKLGIRQQGWIRAAFIAAYFARIVSALDACDSQCRITNLTLIVDSIASVNVTDIVLSLAAILLREVEQRYSKHSQSYRQTQDRVLGIYKVAFGKQPKSLLHKLIRSRWAPLGLEDFYR